MNRGRRRWLRACASALAVCLGFARTAHADDEGLCFHAPVEGQTLRRAGELTRARAAFALCAREVCPALIVQKCTEWVHEVDLALPSVVLVAHDARGGDLLDARVSIDGGPTEPLTPRAIPLDPGIHRFVFQRVGADDVTVDAVVREGEHLREVMGTFSPVTPGRPLARPVPLPTWVTGALGVAGMASFAVFGALGLSERSADHCATQCASSAADEVETKFRVADASLAVGVASAAVATVFYLMRPTRPPSSSALSTAPLAPFGWSFQ